MILEHAVLSVPGQEQDFEAAFAQAKGIIAGMPAFRSLRLDRCVEAPSCYLLLVEWDRLEDHTVGFRGSEQYQQSRASSSTTSMTLSQTWSTMRTWLTNPPADDAVRPAHPLPVAEKQGSAEFAGKRAVHKGQPNSGGRLGT